MGEGTHTLNVYTVDNAGNWQSASYTFITDNTAPMIILEDPEDGSQFQSGAIVVFSVTDDNTIDQVLYNWDGTVNQSLTVDSTYNVDTSELTEGLHGLHVYTMDKAGNWYSETYYFVVDDTPPSTNIFIGEPKYISDAIFITPTTLIALEATDEASGINLTVFKIYNSTYNSGWILYKGPFSLTSLVDGNYTVVFNSTDNVGNVEESHLIHIELFSWDYVFINIRNDDIILKINTENSLFQFISPDFDYGIREATCMKVLKRVIIIHHEDDRLRLVSISIDLCWNFCIVISRDLSTGQKYLLFGKGV